MTAHAALASMILAAPDATGPDLAEAIATAYDWHQGGGGLYAFASTGGTVADAAQKDVMIKEVEDSLAYVRSRAADIDAGKLPELAEAVAEALKQHVSTSTYITERLENLKAAIEQAEAQTEAPIEPPASEVAPQAPVTSSEHKEARTVISVEVFNKARQVAQELLQKLNGSNTGTEGKVNKILFELNEIETKAGGNLSDALDDEVDPTTAAWARNLIQALATISRGSGSIPAPVEAPTPAPEEPAAIQGSMVTADMVDTTVQGLTHYVRENLNRFKTLMGNPAEGDARMREELSKVPGGQMAGMIIPLIKQLAAGALNESAFVGNLENLFRRNTKALTSSFLQEEGLATASTQIKAAVDGSIHIAGIRKGAETLTKVSKFAAANSIQIHMVRAFEDDDDTADCPTCGGPGVPLGVMGSREHLRCRNCGMGYSRELQPEATAVTAGVEPAPETVQFLKAIEDAYHRYLPNSYIRARFNSNLGESISITTMLAASTDECSNHICQNDPIYGTFFIHGLKDGKLPATFTVEGGYGGTLYVKDPTGHLAYNRIRIYRKVSGDAARVLAGMTKFFEKLAATIKTNIDNIKDVPFDVKSKVSSVQQPNLITPPELPYNEGGTPARNDETVFDDVHTAAGPSPENHVIKVGTSYLKLVSDPAELETGGVTFALAPKQSEATRMAHEEAKQWIADDRLSRFIATQDPGTEAQIVRVVPKKASQKTALVPPPPSAAGNHAGPANPVNPTGQPAPNAPAPQPPAPMAPPSTQGVSVTHINPGGATPPPAPVAPAPATGQQLFDAQGRPVQASLDEDTKEVHVEGFATLSIGQIKAKILQQAKEGITRAESGDWPNALYFFGSNGVFEALVKTLDKERRAEWLAEKPEPVISSKQASEGTLNGVLSEVEGNVSALQELADAALAKARLMNDESLVAAVERMNTAIFEAGMAARHSKSLAGNEKAPEAAPTSGGELKEASKTACECGGNCENCKNKTAAVTRGGVCPECKKTETFTVDGEHQLYCDECMTNMAVKQIKDEQEAKATPKKAASVTDGAQAALSALLPLREARVFTTPDAARSVERAIAALSHKDDDPMFWAQTALMQLEPLLDERKFTVEIAAKRVLLAVQHLQRAGVRTASFKVAADGGELSAMAREVTLGWMASHPKQTPDWAGNDWKQLYEENKAECPNQTAFLRACQTAYAEMSHSTKKGALTLASLTIQARGLMGPTAEEGDSVENATKFMHGNAGDIEDETIAGLRQILADAGYSRTVVEMAIEEVFGTDATLANGALLKTLLKTDTK